MPESELTAEIETLHIWLQKSPGCRSCSNNLGVTFRWHAATCLAAGEKQQCKCFRDFLFLFVVTKGKEETAIFPSNVYFYEKLTK